MKSLIVCACLTIGCLFASFFLSPTTSIAADRERDDVKALQGRWEREIAETPGDDSEARGAAKVIKEIDDNKEKVTYQNKSGAVVYETVADFKLEKFGRVKLYTFSNLKVSQGKQDGARDSDKGPVSYIYRVEGDLYYEAHGLLIDSPAGSKPSVVVWKRVK